MVETSFPKIEEPLTAEQWKSVVAGFGTGVLDNGGNPYNLVAVNNVDNTATIAVDTRTGFNHAVVFGFYHKMDAPIVISLPAVAKTTTYYVVLKYDPGRNDAPVKLEVVKSLDTSGGKNYLVLWEVTRQPNQLLTDSVRIKKRPLITPSIMVDTPDSLPNINSVLWGTRAFSYRDNTEYRASHNNWEIISPYRVEVINPPGWEIPSATGGIQVIPTSGGLNCSMAIEPTRRAYQYNMDEKFHGIGTVVPDGYRPTNDVYTLVNQDNAVHEAYLSKTGQLFIRSRNGVYTLRTGSAMAVRFEWFVPKTNL